MTNPTHPAPDAQTPLTDEVQFRRGSMAPAGAFKDFVVPADFARTLERRMARAEAALREAATVFDDLDAVMWDRSGCPVQYTDAQNAANDALAVAEGGRVNATHLRDYWRNIGGSFHGPATIPEERLLPLLDELHQARKVLSSDATELARLREELEAMLSRLKTKEAEIMERDEELADARRERDEARAELISDYEDNPTWKVVAEMWKKEAATMSKAADKWLAERDEALAALRTALATAQADSATWQPIETAPRDGTRILAVNCAMPRHMSLTFWIGAPHNNWRDNIGFTHWQPLPAPPAMKPTP